MCRVGIIGGTFDPIHLAHIYIAEEAKSILDLNKAERHIRGGKATKLKYKVVEWWKYSLYNKS